MRGRWRACLALALHVGVFVLLALVVAGVCGIAAYTYRRDSSAGLRAAGGAAMAVIPIALGLRAVMRPRSRPPRGVAIGRTAQPQLWRMAEVLASASGAPVPNEIRIVPEPTAELRVETALLGMLARRSYLEIGLPLLAGLTVGEMRSVVTRELSRRVAGGRLVTVSCRVRTSVLRAAAETTGAPTAWLFGTYARVLSAITDDVEYEADLVADETCVEITGKRTAVTALRKLVAIELAWRDYVREYLSMAVKIGHAPEVLRGFIAFLDQPERKKELSARSKRVIAEDETGGECPNIRERLEYMKRLPRNERQPDDRPSFALLQSPKKSVLELEKRLLVSTLSARLPWTELARQAGAARVAAEAGQLSAAVRQSGLEIEPTISGVLGALHHGKGADLVNAALDPGLTPDSIPQAVEDKLTGLLGSTVVDALVCAQLAQHELDWSGESTVRLASGAPLDPDRLVRPAVADPRLVPGLHRTLVELGVPLNHARPPATEPAPRSAGVISAVEHAGARFELLVTDRGLLLVPTDSNALRRVLAGMFGPARRAELHDLAEVAATPVSALREYPGAQWVDNRDIAAAKLHTEDKTWSLMLKLYLDDYSLSTLDTDMLRYGADNTAAIRLRSTADSEERGDPYRGLAELIGARMRE